MFDCPVVKSPNVRGISYLFHAFSGIFAQLPETHRSQIATTHRTPGEGARELAPRSHHLPGRGDRNPERGGRLAVFGVFVGGVRGRCLEDREVTCVEDLILGVWAIECWQMRDELPLSIYEFGDLP